MKFDMLTAKRAKKTGSFFGETRRPEVPRMRAMCPKIMEIAFNDFFLVNSLGFKTSFFHKKILNRMGAL